MSTMSKDEFTIHLPALAGADLPQDQEYFEVEHGGRRRRLRFHDYAEIYAIPGLYEQLFSDMLQCQSPQVLVGLLRQTLVAHHQEPADLRVLDFGAGNGMVGEELDRIGAGRIVGVDQLEEARAAAARDRPGIYDAYHAIDITAPGRGVREELEQAHFNCLTCCAALGFGDVPPQVFSAALGLVDDQGWVAFNLRDQVATSRASNGFAPLLAELSGGKLVERAWMRYPHRLGLSGEPLEYIAIIAQKR